MRMWVAPAEDYEAALQGVSGGPSSSLAAATHERLGDAGVALWRDRGGTGWWALGGILGNQLQP